MTRRQSSGYEGPTDLDPSEIRVIAGLAGGLKPVTVERYLAGLRTWPDKSRAIEHALRQLGRENLIRRGAA